MIALLLTCLLNFSHATDSYTYGQTVPLNYTRVIGGTSVTGLTVTVKVANAKTNAAILASTAVAETATGSGVYNYNWTTGIFSETLCLVTYTVGSSIYKEYILITNSGFGGRGA